MDTSVIDRPRGRDMLHVPRTKGALSGLLIVAAGIWGAFIPLVGPYFNFGFTTEAWSWTANQFWLSLLPGIAAVVAGLVLLYSGNRATAALGATLAAVAGVWFIVGPPLSQIWNPGAFGTPIGGQFRQALVLISFYYGLGALILFLGSGALGRLSVVGVRDVAAARNRRLGRAEPAGRHARGHRHHDQVGADHPEHTDHDEHPGRRERVEHGGPTTTSGDRYDEAAVYPDEPYPDESRRSHNNGHGGRRVAAGPDRGTGQQAHDYRPDQSYQPGDHRTGQYTVGGHETGGRDTGGYNSGGYGGGGYGERRYTDSDSGFGERGYGDGGFGGSGYGDSGYGGYEVGKHRRAGGHPAAGNGADGGTPARDVTDRNRTGTTGPGSTTGPGGTTGQERAGEHPEHWERRPGETGDEHARIADEPIGAGAGARPHRHHWWERH